MVLAGLVGKPGIKITLLGVKKYRNIVPKKLSTKDHDEI